MTTITPREPALPEATCHLGMSEEVIEQGIGDGWSLADAAYATGKELRPLEAAMCEAAEADVTDALESGRVTTAEAGALRTHLAGYIADVIDQAGA
jgi:hypothetical protein